MKICPNCHSIIPGFRNGNRRYCGNQCYSESKRLRQKMQRKLVVAQLNASKHAAAILGKLCIKHGSGRAFDPIEAENQKFDFGISNGIKFMDGKQTIVIGEFAYLLTDAKRMTVWKI